MTSAFGVPAAAGIPVTQRGLAASVTVVTGRVGEQDGTSAHDWEALARVGGTLVILMGMGTARRHRSGVGAGRPSPPGTGGGDRAGDDAVAAVARTTLAGLADVELGSPAVIVVGPVAALGPHDAPRRSPGVPWAVAPWW